MEMHQIYKDIQARTKGDFYLGIVGPVRCGKSTFIKRFMNEIVLTEMKEDYRKKVAMDELPQSASGRMIMTVEPKFIPQEAAKIKLKDNTFINVRLIDSVGYLIDNKDILQEESTERMIKTPWFPYDIPFSKAAEIGTGKVINEHATIGVVITTDGSFGEIGREHFIQPEEKAITELKKIGKPFIVVLNSKTPDSDRTKSIKKEIEEKYEAAVFAVDCEIMTKGQIYQMLEMILMEFPITAVEIFIPKWIELLENEHEIKINLFANVKKYISELNTLKDFQTKPFHMEGNYIEKNIVENIDYATGIVKIKLEYNNLFYYKMLSELFCKEITNEEELLEMMKELCEIKKVYEMLEHALNEVNGSGYGIVSPKREEIDLEEPVLWKQGNKYGIKIHAKAPTIHMINAQIETEVAPIIGTEQQALELLEHLKTNETMDSIWNINIFGKTLEKLIIEGINHKIDLIGNESRDKIQSSLQKIVNDTNGGIICIII